MANYELSRNYERMKEKLTRHFYCIGEGEHMPQYIETREEFEQFIKFLKYVNKNKDERNFNGQTKRLISVPTKTMNVPVGRGNLPFMRYIYVEKVYEWGPKLIDIEKDSWNEIQFDKFILTDYDIPTPCVAVLNYPLRGDGIKLQIYSSIEEYKKAFKDKKPHGHIFTWEELLETIKMDMSIAVELEVYDCETKEYYDDIDFEITTSGAIETAHIPKGEFYTTKRLLKGGNWSVKIKNNLENCKTCSPSNGFIYGDYQKNKDSITFKIDENIPKKYKLIINGKYGSEDFLSHSSIKLLNYLRKRITLGDKPIFGFSFYDLDKNKEIYNQSGEITLDNVSEKFDYDKILEIVDPHKKYILEVTSDVKSFPNKIVYSVEGNNTKEMLPKLVNYLLNKAILQYKDIFVVGNFEISIRKYREDNILYKFICEVSGIENCPNKDIKFYDKNSVATTEKNIDNEMTKVLKI